MDPKLEELIRKLKEIQETGINIDTRSIEDAADAASILKEAIKITQESTELTNEQYIRAANLISQASTQYSNLSDATQATTTEIASQNKEIQKQKDILEDITGISEERAEQEKQIANQLRQQELTSQKFKQRLADIFKFVKAINLEFNKLSTEVNTLTATQGMYNELLVDATTQTLAFGGGYERTGKAFGTLFSSFNKFSSMTIKQQTEMAALSSKLDRAGFAMEDFAKFSTFASNALGMGAGQIEQYSKELLSFGQQAGIPFSILTKELNAFAPKMAALGKDGPRVFKEMAAASKALGIEISELNSIMEQFETVQNATAAAAKVNAVLGGNLVNGFQLMEAAGKGDIEVFRLMKQSLIESGKSIDDMTLNQKKLIAESYGIKDVSTLMKIMKGDVDELADSLAATAKTEEEFNKLLQSFVPIGEKFKNILISLAPIFNVLLSAINSVLDSILWLTTSKDNLVLKILAVGGALALLIGTFTVLGKGFSFLSKFFMGPINKGIEIFGSSIANVGRQIGRAGVSMNKGALGMLAFGAAISLVGAGIWLAATGLAELVKSFSTLTGGEIAGAISSLTVVMIGFVAMLQIAATVGTAAAPAMLAIGAAAALIGAGIWLAATGFSSLVSSIIELVKQGPQATAFFTTTILQITSLAAAFMYLALASPGLMIAAAGIAAIGLSLSLFKDEFVQAGESMEKFQKALEIQDTTIAKLQTISSIFKNISKSIKEAASSLESFNTITAAFMAPAIIAAAAVPAMATGVATAPTAVGASTLSPTVAGAGGDTATTYSINNSTKESKTINVNLKLDMPVLLNGREIQRIADERVLKILDETGQQTLTATDVNRGTVAAKGAARG